MLRRASRRASRLERVAATKDDCTVEPGIAQLQHYPPIDGLDVAKPGLGVDADPEPVSDQCGIPCAKVARDRHRDLRSPRERGSHRNTKRSKQGELGDVADSAARGVCPCRQLQPDRSQELGDDDERHVRMAAPLEDADAGVRQPDRVAQPTLTQVPRDAGIANLAQQLREESLCAQSIAAVRPLTGRHSRIVAGAS